MGIIDDYYGGYESLALFMDSDGGIDYDAAYDAQIPDGDDCFGMDAFNRALDYKFKQELRKFERASRRKKLPGWKDTGNKTSLGKPIYEGICTSCHKQCTVPFAPLAGGKPPKCKSCLNAAEDQIERDYIENYIATFTQEIDDDPDVDDEFKTHCKEELRKDLEELCQEQKQQRQQHLQSQRDQHKKSSSQLLPGWTATGNTTFYGKPIYKGNCSSCQQQCTVPFAPVAGASPPMCKQCLGQNKGHAGASSSSGGAGTSKAAELAGSSSVPTVAAEGQQQHEQD